MGRLHWFVRCNCLTVSYCYFPNNVRQFQWNSVQLCTYCTFRHLKETALFLFGVHKFHKVHFKAAEEGRTEVGLDIIGAHGRVHLLSKSSLHQRIKVLRLLFVFSGIWWLSGLLWADHCDCSAFIIMSGQISVHVFSLSRQTELNWTEPSAPC